MDISDENSSTYKKFCYQLKKNRFQIYLINYASDKNKKLGIKYKSNS